MCIFKFTLFIGNLTIPNSVTRINWEAFINCDKFNGKLNLGKVEYIATGAFTNCSGFYRRFSYSRRVIKYRSKMLFKIVRI